MNDRSEFAGRLLAERYRLPLPPADEYELTESVAYDTASGQEVLVRQVPLPEVLDAEFAELAEETHGFGPGGGRARRRAATRRPADPVVRRAVEAARGAAAIPDHPRLDQVFDVFVEGEGLWIVSELVPARPLAALLAERPLSAHRAAELAADVLAALRTVHAHGWTHRNITARSVLVCEDGRALLTGFVEGAAQEALCGYDPLPPESGAESGAVPAGSVPAGSAEGPAPHAPQEADGPPTGNAAGAGGARAALATAREEEEAPAQHPGVPATFAAPPLPEGFVPQQAGPHGTPSPYRGGEQDAGLFGFSSGPAQQGSAPPGPAEAGAGSDSRPPGDGWPSTTSGAPNYGPVAPGYRVSGPVGVPRPDGGGLEEQGADSESSARAARRGAIAAYRAGAQRAAAESREGQGAAPYGAQGEEQWWAPPAAAPDDDVRLLPAESDEVLPGEDGVAWEAETEEFGSSRDELREGVYGPLTPSGPPPSGRAEGTETTGPAALPGARPAQGQWVRAEWRAEPQAGARARDAYGPDGEPYGPARPLGAEAGASPYGQAPPEAGYGTGAAASQGSETRSAQVLPASVDAHGVHAYVPPSGRAEPVAPEPPDADADDAPRHTAAREPDGWGTAERYHGPTTTLAAERARQARMTMIGAVTERWAPEQAGPVYANWRLAPPVGPAADLWALGVLLFRAVQGHAPYPEDSVAELVQMVCAEPPAFAEDCGALRPIVESLLRQDPTERPEFEELRGWLRSLIRSAPEPEVGRNTVLAPPSLEPGGPADPHRLPIVRRRGELVRRRREQRRAEKRARQEARARGEAEAAEQRVQLAPGSEEPAGRKAAKPAREPKQARTPKPPKPPKEPKRSRQPKGPREPRIGGGGRRPLRLGRLLLGAVLLALTAAVLYAMWFMPGAGEGEDAQRQGSVGAPERPSDDGDGAADDGKEKGSGGSANDGAQQGGSGPSASKGLPKGYKMSRDPKGFQVAVPRTWDRRSMGERGEVRYNGGSVEMVVVGGRDTTGKYGKDPMEYQLNLEPELKAYRSHDFDTASQGLRRIDVGAKAIAEGAFSWPDESGGTVYARNRAMIYAGKYHVLLVKGPQSQRDEVDETFEAVADTYSASGS